MRHIFCSFFFECPTQAHILYHKSTQMSMLFSFLPPSPPPPSLFAMQKHIKKRPFEPQKTPDFKLFTKKGKNGIIITWHHVSFGY